MAMDGDLKEEEEEEGRERKRKGSLFEKTDGSLRDIRRGIADKGNSFG